MNMTMRKAIITVTVLYDEEEFDLSSCPLDVIAEAIDTGPAMGSFTITSDEPVPPEQVNAEAEALGGDGSFFGTGDA